MERCQHIPSCPDQHLVPVLPGHPEEGGPLGGVAPLVQVTRVEIRPQTLQVQLQLPGRVSSVYKHLDINHNIINLDI